MNSNICWIVVTIAGAIFSFNNGVNSYDSADGDDDNDMIDCVTVFALMLHYK